VTGLPNRILVIRGGAIGDFILTLPVLAALRRQFPASRLELLGYPHIAQLALAGGLVDAVRSIEARALAGFFAAGAPLAEALADYFGSFAVIVSYLYDPDGVFQANVARCSKALFLAGPHRPDDRGGVPAAEALLGPLSRLAIFDADPVPRLTLPARTSARASRVALHPGSGSERKNWPEAKWAEFLGQLLARSERDLTLVGGEAEGNRLERLARALPAARVQLARSLPLTELAGVLSSCAAFVGHDSGISHLAAALGLPCLLLWGDTPQTVWRPPSPRVRLLQEAQGLSAMPVERVLAGALELVSEVALETGQT
jgi:heptosyltransferase-2